MPRIGERGQVVVPKRLRQKYGLRPDTEVEFLEEGGRLVLARRDGYADPVGALVGLCTGRGPWRTTDEYLEETRGR